MSKVKDEDTILDPIKHIIESHKHAVSGGEVTPGNYWRSRFPSKFSDQKNDQVATDHFHHNHHVGLWWVGHGMKVSHDEKSTDPKSRELISVMNFIKEKLIEDKKSKPVDNNLIEVFGEMFEKDSDPKKLSSMKQSILLVIKAIAVSLLAEFNGQSEPAKKLIEQGGMKAVQSLTVNGMQQVLGHLENVNELSMQNGG